jgi:hypothetical protein
LGDAEEEPGADGAAEGDQLDVPAFEAAFEFLGSHFGQHGLAQWLAFLDRGGRAYPQLVLEPEGGFLARRHRALDGQQAVVLVHPGLDGADRQVVAHHDVAGPVTRAQAAELPARRRPGDTE